MCKYSKIHIDFSNLSKKKTRRTNFGYKRTKFVKAQVSTIFENNRLNTLKKSRGKNKINPL